MAILFDKKTKHRYIDAKIKKADGTYFHFVRKDSSNDLWKYKNNVAKVAPQIIEEAKRKQGFITQKEITNIDYLVLFYLANNPGIADGTKEQYLHYFNNYVIPYFKNNLTSFFDRQTMSCFKTYIYNLDNLKVSTKKTFMRLVRAIIHYSRKIGLINSDLRDDLLDSFTTIKEPIGYKEEKHNRYTPIEELKEMLPKIEDINKRQTLLLLYFSGCRISEFLGIKFKNVSFNEDKTIATIKIEGQNINGKYYNRLKTNASYREIHYFSSNALILNEYLERNKFDLEDFIFPYGANTIRYILRKYLKNRNTIHGFGRLSLNEELYKKGVDSRTRATILGQSNIAINETHYLDKNEEIKIANEHLKAITNNF